MNGMRSKSSIPIEYGELEGVDPAPLQSRANSHTMITDKMKFFLLLLAAAIAQSAAAQDTKTVVTAGASNAAAPVSMCIGCHAIPGYQASFPYVYRVPKIGGQSQPYIEAALKAYRQGARNHPSMTAVAKGLTDEQISAVAAYYAARGDKDKPVVAAAK